MNLVPNMKIEQLIADIEAIETIIEHTAHSKNHDKIRLLVDERRQALAELTSELKLAQRQQSIAATLTYTANQKTKLFVNAWCDRIKNATPQDKPFLNLQFCHLFLDHTLPKAWNFNTDVLVIHAPTSSRMLHTAKDRGQKNIVAFDVNKSLQPDELAWASQAGILLCHTTRDIEIAFATLQSPAEQVITISCDPDPAYAKDTKPLINQAITNGKKNRSENTLTATKFGKPWSTNVIKNLHHLAQNPNFHQLSVSGVENAVIVASGPSLTKNIGFLSKIQDSVFIVSALRSLPLLHKANIRPDLVIQLDAEDDQVAEELLKNLDFHIPNFLLELTVNQNFFKAQAEQKICSLSRLFSDTHEFLGSKPTPFDSPSVSIYALYLCIFLKFKNVCFVGQDLAADGQKQYADGATSLLPAHAKLSMFDIEVPGFYGDTVLTRSAYHHQLKKCSNIARDLTTLATGTKLVNATEGGAFIEGFDHMSLKSFAKQQGLEGRPKTKALTFTGEAGASEADILSYLKTVSKNMRQIVKIADKVIKLDQEPNKHRGLQRKIEKEISKFKSLNKNNSLLQISMQENIAKVIGTTHEAQKISSYSEFFEKTKSNALYLMQVADQQLQQ